MLKRRRIQAVANIIRAYNDGKLTEDEAVNKLWDLFSPEKKDLEKK